MTLDSPAALDAAANRTIQIESGFKPGQKTGSYSGLGQWSAAEMKRHGITDPDSIEQTRAALKTDIQTRAAKLQKDGLPATAANVYLMHQQGEAGLEAHLRNPDKPAWESVRFGYKNDAIAKRAIWGNMTDAMKRQFPDGVESVTSGDFTRLWEARYNGTDLRGTTVAKGAEAAAERAPLATNMRFAPRHVPGTRRDVAEGTTNFTPGAREQTDWGGIATEHAPAIGSTIGAVGGSLVAPGVGTVAGGGAGGAAGQALKDYLKGNPQNLLNIGREGALGAVLGVAGPEGRPVVGAAARALGVGGVEGGAKALEGGDTEDVVTAAAKGTGAAALGEGFGRALGMAGHKVWSMFAPDAKQAIVSAAGDLHAANEVLRTEQPKILSAAGSAIGPNPKYDAAKAAKDKAEIVLKDAGLNPEEAAYAHRVAGEGVPKREAIVNRPGEIEKRDVGAGYQQLEQELPPRKGLKASEDQIAAMKKLGGRLADGPIAAVVKGDVVQSKTNTELAQHVEAAITAPAKTWAEKWSQLKDARTDLLQAERDALSSTAAGRTQTAKDMRALADTVRTQQEKIATTVFGKKDGDAFVARLKVLDTRYAKLMDATNGGDIAKAVAMKGEAGRDAEKRFMAFASRDPEARAAYRAMRGVKGNAFEATVPWTVAAEGLPFVGKVVKVTKLAGMLTNWMAEHEAGSPVRFRDLVKFPHDDNGQLIRSGMGGAGARAAVSATQ